MTIAAARASTRIALVLTSLMATGPATAAGTWVADSVTPAIRQQGMRYTSEPLAPRASTPLAGDRINRVSWRYGFSRWAPDLNVTLCGGGRCVEIEGERGNSRAFAGLAPATTFAFHFVVEGRREAIVPLYGEPLQLVVNFE